MVGMVLPKIWDTAAKALAGIGALNLGLVEFVNLNVLDYVPDVASKIVIGTVGISGIYVLQLLYNKRI